MFYYYLFYYFVCVINYPTYIHITHSHHQHDNMIRVQQLTSFLSCRHSSTDRLFVQVCFGHRRVTSSRQACSSASFQLLGLLIWEPEDAAAAAAAAALFPGFGIAALSCWWMATAGKCTFPNPGGGLRACTASRQTDMRSSSGWTRLHAAIFGHNSWIKAPFTPLLLLPPNTQRWPTGRLYDSTTAKTWLMNINDATRRRFMNINDATRRNPH